MKKIFPAVDKKVITKVNESFITKEQYDELVRIVNEYKEDTERAITDLNAFKSTLSNQVTTRNIDSETADIETLNANEITVDNLNATNLGDFIDTIVGIIKKDSAFVKLTDSGITIGFNNQPVVSISEDTVTIAADLLVNDIEANDVNANNAELDGNLIVHGNAVFDNPPEQRNANLTGITHIEEEEVDVSRINTAEITHIAGTEAELTHLLTNSLEADSFIAQDYTRISHNYRKNKPQEIDAELEDYWIEIPNFKNGEYYVYSALAGREQLDWSFEAFNSIDNPMFRWSESELGRIEDVTLLTYQDGTARYIIHIKSTNELALLYSGSNSFEIAEYSTGWNSPTIYNYNPYEHEEKYKTVEINDLKGTYIPNATYAGEFHAEGMVVDQFIFDKLFVRERIGFTVEKGNEEKGYNVGTTGDYITNVSKPNEQNDVRVDWVSPSKKAGDLDYGSAIQPLVTEDTVAHWTGKSNEWSEGRVVTIEQAFNIDTLQMSVGGAWTSPIIEQIDENTYTLNGSEVPSTYKLTIRTPILDEDDNAVSIYPIVHTGDNTEVHGDIKVDNDETVEHNLLVKNDTEIRGNTKTKHIYDGHTADMPTMPDDSLVIKYGTHEEEGEVVDDTPIITRKRTFEREGGGVDVKYDELAVKNADADWSDERDKKPIVYNYDRDALETADSLKIDDIEVDNLKVNNNLDVGNDVRVAGDLYVTGTTHTVNEETIESKSDTIVLREGAQHALMPGQESGIIVNNIDGEGSDLSIVTDETGVLRIGVAQGTKTTYTDISYNSHTDKWYSRTYNDVTDEWEYEELNPQPQGEVADEQGKVENDPYTDYDEVTFTVIDKESLQPFLTREEEHDINDEGILKYNKDTHRSETISLPTINGQSLTGKYNEDTEKWEYEWGGTDKPSIFRFETYEDYQEALEIEEGSEGYIPSGSIIVIEGNYDDITGVD